MKDCINCKHKYCWEYAEPCNSCTDIDNTGKPTNWEAQTRADRVRGMTDEDLAEFLEKVGGCGPSFDKEYCNNVNGCPEGINCWLDWLKQEESDG